MPLKPPSRDGVQSRVRPSLGSGQSEKHCPTAWRHRNPRFVRGAVRIPSFGATQPGPASPAVTSSRSLPATSGAWPLCCGHRLLSLIPGNTTSGCPGPANSVSKEEPVSLITKLKQTAAKLAPRTERERRNEESMRQVDANARGETATDQSASDEAARGRGNPPEQGGQG